jgi:hypothetical protein
MSHLKRWLCLGLSFLGLLGAAGCAALTGGVWVVDARLSRITKAGFERLKGSSTFVRDAIRTAEQRVEKSKVATEEVKTALQDWANRGIGERLGVRLEVNAKTQGLTSVLQQVNARVDTSAASVELIRQAIDLANGAGAAIETDWIDGSLETIASLRSQLEDVIERVDDIRNHIGNGGEDGVTRERLEHAGRLAIRILASLGVIQSHLQQFDAQLNTNQRELRIAESKLLRLIHTVAIVSTILCVWMFAGQLALCRYGWGISRSNRKQTA